MKNSRGGPQKLTDPEAVPPWIDIQATIDQFGYDPRLIRRKSAKLVIRVCQQCGLSTPRPKTYAVFQSLCLLCSNRNNAKKNIARRSIAIRAHWAANGHPRLGVPHTAESKLKMSASSLGHVTSAETKAKLAISSTGKIPSEATLAKLRAKGLERRGANNPRFGVPPPHTHKTWVMTSNGRKCFRSQWEAAFAIFLDRQLRPWDYETHTFRVTLPHTETTYTPDFYLRDDGSYVEIKGLLRQSDADKLSAFRSQYPALSLLVLRADSLIELGILQKGHRVAYDYRTAFE